MIETLKKEKIPLLIIFSIYILVYILTYACCGDPIIDCGREAYIPFAIAKGKLLYKDIFCIYGAFPYLFLAFIFKIFTAKLDFLYSIGGIFGILYILGVYLCSREFLSKPISTSLCILLIFSVIFDPSIFNFIFPYSYAIVFASTFSIWILYFLIKYIQTKNAKFMHYCAVLWGAICVSKIDFIPVIIIIATVFVLLEQNKKKEIIKFIFYSAIIPLITYLVIFTQGISIFDIIKNSQYVSKMMNTDALYYFYKNLSIVFFSWNNFLTNIKNLIATLLISLIYFTVFLYAIRKRNNLIKYGLSGFISLFCMYIFAFRQTIIQVFFATLPYICTIIFLAMLIKYVRAKEYKNTKNIILLVLFAFALLCSIKNYHSLLLSSYGTYSFAPLLICLVYYIKELLKNNAIYNTKKQYETVLCGYLIILSILFAFQTTVQTYNDNSIIKTKFGKIKTNENFAEPINETLKYIKAHSLQDGTIMVLPESIIFNFLTGKKTEFYQTSFIPLDFETFSEDNIIKDIFEKKPEFIVFTNRNTSEYGKSYICRDYGVKTCKYIVNNYSLEAAFGEKFRIYIFKYKDKENEKE